jgi:hypothetical protein
MSDYLTNLAARTLGLEEGVRPRLPSLFDPLHAERLVPLAFKPAESELEMDGEANAPHDAAPLSPIARRRRSSVPRSSSWPTRLHSDQARWPERDLSSGPFERAAAPQRSRGATSAAQLLSPEPPRPPVPQSVQPSLQPEPDTFCQPREGSPAPMSLPTSISSLQLAERASLNVRESKSAPAVVPTAPAHKSACPGATCPGATGNIHTRLRTCATAMPLNRHPFNSPPSAVILRPHVQPNVQPNLEPAFRTSLLSQEEPESPQPTIQVTIGRIEVRATPAPRHTAPA